ncbi:hexamerin-like [Cydia strobilella]|uniref:hexamerin-like n=1 Tax=Cydia strobilella TaxID=1100964 RepID=UPI00300758D7
MKELTVILVTALAAGSLGFLIKVPDIQQPTSRTSSMGWIHMQKLLLPLFDNVCEESTDPTIVRLSQEFTLDSIADKYTDPEIVNNLKKLYAVNGQLQKGVIFTELNKDHMFEFQLLYDVLYNAQTFDTFYKTAAWARQNVNCGLFVNAIYLAILKRRDTEKITVPAPYELLPHYFIRQDIIIKASSLLAGGDVAVTENIVNEGNSYILDANYTCNIDASGESKLAYFHEDVGLNTYYFLKKLQYAPWFNTEDVNSNHAEYLYHFLKQLTARYNLERYSNGLTPLERFDWTTSNVDTYDPMLVFSNGQGFTPRLIGLDITGLNTLQNIEDSAMKMIPTLVQNGYTKSQIISNLMNLLMTNAENYELDVRRFFGGVATENRCRSVLAHYMTSLRDPVSWKINKKIVDIVDEALKSIPGYIRNELYFPGVQVVNVEVKKLTTMFEPFKFEVTDALRISTDRPMFDVNVVESRLNHKPFTLKLNISSLVSQTGLVKIYLGPKILPGEFATKKHLYMLLDNFECNLKIGSNMISRTSNAIERTSEDFVSLKVLRKLVEDAEFGLDVQPLNSLENLSGFPSRLVLPKGTSEGLPMQLLVFVAPFIKVTAAGINVMPKTEYNSAILSPGYPFDLDFDDKQFFSLPNVLVKDIIITHKESSGANKGEYDGSKKWGGSDKTNTYGLKKEPYDYNLKKTQYGKSQDYEAKKDDHATIAPKINDKVVTDNIQVIKDYEVDGQSNLNPEADPGSYFSDKEPYALRLRNSPYEVSSKNDYEARKQKYNYEEKRNKYNTRNEARRSKYYNKYVIGNRTPNPKNDKLEDKLNINDDERYNIDVMKSVMKWHPKTTLGNNIEDTDEKVISKNEAASTSEAYLHNGSILQRDDYIYE